MNTRARLVASVAETLGVAPDRITDAATIYGDLGADSLDIVELLMTVEEAFGIELADATVDEVKTFGDLLRTVEAAMEAAMEAANG